MLIPDRVGYRDIGRGLVGYAHGLYYESVLHDASIFLPGSNVPRRWAFAAFYSCCFVGEKGTPNASLVYVTTPLIHASIAGMCMQMWIYACYTN